MNSDIFQRKKKFDWIERIRTILENNDGQTIDFNRLKKEILRQYRQVYPHSDKTSRELTELFEQQLDKAPFLTRLGNDICYLYFISKDQRDFF